MTPRRQEVLRTKNLGRSARASGVAADLVLDAFFVQAAGARYITERSISSEYPLFPAASRRVAEDFYERHAPVPVKHVLGGA